MGRRSCVPGHKHGGCVMNLYIQIKDGQPFQHPLREQNLVRAFPGIDLENLPPEFSRFVRVPQPALGDFEVCEGSSYGWVGDVVCDVWYIRPMTEDEKTAKLQEMQEMQDLPDDSG